MGQKKLNIAVLMGGSSPERDVSLASGTAVIKGLQAAGHKAVGIDPALGTVELTAVSQTDHHPIKPQPPSPRELPGFPHDMLMQTLASPDLRQADLIFVILHGGFGENGVVQAVLELIGVPYTGSGVMASAIAMDKHFTKKVFQASGVPTPEYMVRCSGEIRSDKGVVEPIHRTLGFPVVVKPNSQGSSVGLGIAHDAGQLYDIALKASEYSDKVLFERFISGRELTVSVLGNETLPVAEVRPQGGLYDYRHKYTSGMTEYLVPAPLSTQQEKAVRRLGMLAFESLGCRGFARVDFRMSDGGELYCLEVNTLPGMTPASLVPKAAKAAGIDFPQLVDRICQIALEDFKGRRSS